MKDRERQEALSNFIERETYYCQSSLVEEAFKAQFFSIDDIVNLYKPFDGQLIHPHSCVCCQKQALCLDSETGECETCFEENQEPREIYEWWLVSPWLSKRLLMEDEPILDNDYGVWWGRCTTGQAISQDYVIQKIYDDMMSYAG